MNERVFSHSAPLSNRDFDFFYDGLEKEELLLQLCSRCDALRTPPGPACPNCGSTAWTTIRADGRGTLFSYTVHHHPPLPGFATPHPVGIVELAEGVRLVGALDSLALDEIAIGMALEVEFLRRGEVASYRFGRCTQSPGGGR
jgi:uncharacterized OB-fold protein